MRRAVSKARRGLGPTLLELDTYRWCPHVGPEDDDHFNYRPPEELAAWQENCPIVGLRSTLTENGILSETDIQEVAKEVKEEVQAAFTFAKASPFPPASSFDQFVFSNKPEGCGIPIKERPQPIYDHQQTELVPRPY